MNRQAELLDKVRAAMKASTDMALAERIGVQRQAVSKWRNCEKPLPDERIAQLCALAHLDAGAWAAAIHAERAASNAERAMWKSVLDRLGPVAAAVGLVAFGLALSGAPVHGETGAISRSTPILPIMSTLRRLFTRLRASWTADRTMTNGPQTPVLA